MPEDFRLATYNLENFDDEVPEPLFAARVRALRPVLETLAADVLCLQEIDAQPRNRSPRTLRALRRLIDGTSYEGFHLVCSEPEPGHGPADRHNLVVLSRFPVLASRSIRHELVPPPAHGLPIATGSAFGKPPPGAAGWDRPLQHVTLGLPVGKRLEVVNLHLRAPLAAHVAGAMLAPQVWSETGAWAQGFYVSVLKRIGQALEARLVVDRLYDGNPAALIAVTGDLNADSFEMPIRLLQAGAADTGNPALAARRLGQAADRLPPTRRFTVRHGGRTALFDHILLSPALFASMRSIDALNEGLADEAESEAAGTRPAASYHAPLVARFSL